MKPGKLRRTAVSIADLDIQRQRGGHDLAIGSDHLDPDLNGLAALHISGERQPDLADRRGGDQQQAAVAGRQFNRNLEGRSGSAERDESTLHEVIHHARRSLQAEHRPRGKTPFEDQSVMPDIVPGFAMIVDRE